MAQANTGSSRSRIHPLIGAVLLAAVVPRASLARTPDSGGARVSAAASWGALPIRFEPNVGQADERVHFTSRGPGHGLLLTADEAVLALRGANQALRMRLVGARKARSIRGEDVLAGHSNYYLGNDPRRWRTGVPAYAKVRYTDVYPGIDLVYHGGERQLEYDFVVAPGADPAAIGLRLEGAEDARLTPEGDLVLRVGGSEVRQRRPLVYQEVDGERRAVDGGYVLSPGARVAFAVGPYDKTRPLVIDPVVTLAYSTYYGGSSAENTIYSGIAIDAAGAAYIAGNTHSLDIPGAGGPKPGGPSSDVFVAKINAAGDGIEYATYLGGPIDEEGHDVAVDPSGYAYVVGFIHSPGTGFPTLNAFQPAFGGGIGDAIVAKLAPDGTLVYSSYLGGRAGGIDRSYERAHAVATDAEGHMYVTGGTGSTIGFPVVGAIQPTNRGGFEMFVTKISANGDAVLFSTYVGGPLTDVGYNIEVDAQQAIHVVGTTTSVDNPATPANEGMPVVNAFQPTFGGVQDAFVFKMNPSGTLFEFATYLGGTGSESADPTLVAPTGGVAVDAEGNVYVAGHTQSANFPTTPNRLHAYTGSQDCFVTKLTPDGSALVYSTFLGGAAVVDNCLGLAVDPTGSAYVTGYSNRGFLLVNALPMYAGILNTNNGTGLDAIVSKLSPDGGSLIYSTYLGGRARDQAHEIAVDARGNAYITGVTYSFTFPLEAPLDSSCAGCTEGGQFEGSNEAFVAKLLLGNLTPAAADDDGYETDEDAVLTVDAPGVLTNDTDGNSDPLTAVLLTAPGHGTLDLAADGSFTYTPATDWSGTDSFTYKASDGALESSPATVTLTVRPVNDAPAADAGGPYAVVEGAAVALAGSGDDVEGDALTYAWDLDSDATFETPGQTPELTAPNGPATLTVFLRVTDAGGAVGTASATVTVANRVPSAAADAYSTPEDTPLVVAAPGVLGNDQDFDALSAVLVAPPAHGMLTLAADGSFHYAPAPNFNGTDAYTYRAHDGGDSSEPVTVTLGVGPVNDPPSADGGGPYAVGEGGSLTLTGSGQDVEGGPLTFAWDLDDDGTFETPGASPVLTAGNGPDTLNVTLRVSDAGGVSATSPAIVDVLNATPVAAADAFAATAGVPLTVGAPGVLANDTDFDALTAVLVAGPSQGTLALGADGSFQYVPGPGAGGTDAFTYAASDGVATSAAATVTITIAAGGPDAVNDTFVVKRRLRAHTLAVLANDDAGANGPLAITSVSSPARGTAAISADGRSIVYRARFRFLGTDTFTYTVTDGNGGTDTATVTVNVTRRRNP